MITQTFKEFRFTCKVVLFILILVPLFLLFIDVVNNDLGPDPAKAMAHITGEWAMRLLLVTLAISPLRKLTGTTEWIHYRRMLGLFTFFYASLHLLTYFFFLLGLQWRQLWTDVLDRPYITVGFFAWMMLVPLAITSTKDWQRRLGRRWPQLHRCIFIALLLALLHIIWQVRSDLSEALLYSFIALLLLSFRSEKILSGFRRSS
tara:strand:- start:39 stop:650 length:612 start_codon:yes stop_codon:yes gene_type:complete